MGWCKLAKLLSCAWVLPIPQGNHHPGDARMITQNEPQTTFHVKLHPPAAAMALSKMMHTTAKISSTAARAHPTATQHCAVRCPIHTAASRLPHQPQHSSSTSTSSRLLTCRAVESSQQQQQAEASQAPQAVVQPEAAVPGMSAYLDSLRWATDGLVPVIVQVTWRLVGLCVGVLTCAGCSGYRRACVVCGWKLGQRVGLYAAVQTH